MAVQVVGGAGALGPLGQCDHVGGPGFFLDLLFDELQQDRVGGVVLDLQGQFIAVLDAGGDAYDDEIAEAKGNEEE